MTAENMHEYYWDNYTEMDQYGYEDYDNQQALLQQTNANAEKLKLKHRYERMMDAPFFGRVDFIFPADYREGSALERTMQNIIRKMAVSHRLEVESSCQLQAIRDTQHKRK